jgi:membrane dipeptidase
MGDDLLIIDTLSHGPIVWDEHLTASNDQMLASGVSPFRIGQDLMAQMAHAVVSDPDYFEQYQRAWLQCGVTCVSWTLGVIHEQPYSLEAAYHNYGYMTHMLDHRRELLVKVVRTEDIERAHGEGKRAIIFNFQNLDHIGSDLELLDRFYEMGFRVMQLTYNSQNQIGYGCTEEVDLGLSDFGRSVVDRLNELGVIVDLSHCGTRTSMDAVLHSQAPVACTHTFAKSLYEHDRGKEDDLLRAIAEREGYIGILAVPGFLTPESKTTVKDFLDHLDYVVKLVGLDYVGVGSDFFGFSVPKRLAEKVDALMGTLGFRPEHRASFAQKVEGFEDYTAFPNLIAGLRDRGYDDDQMRKLVGGNFLRLFRVVVG